MVWVRLEVLIFGLADGTALWWGLLSTQVLYLTWNGAVCFIHSLCQTYAKEPKSAYSKLICRITLSGHFWTRNSGGLRLAWIVTWWEPRQSEFSSFVFLYCAGWLSYWLKCELWEVCGDVKQIKICWPLGRYYSFGKSELIHDAFLVNWLWQSRGQMQRP